MPAGARFVPNPQGMREILRTPQVEQGIRGEAEQVASRARSRAPVLTGAYRDSIHVEMLDKPAWERPRARAIADDYKSSWIEWGTVHMTAQRVLGGAAG